MGSDRGTRRDEQGRQELAAHVGLRSAAKAAPARATGARSRGGELLLVSGLMSFGTCTRTLMLVAWAGQFLAACGQDTPDHLDFALRSLNFKVSSQSPQWRQAPPSGIPNMVCAGPQAVTTDCCSPPPPAQPVDCQQHPLACDPSDNFCALIFDVETRVDVDLVADVAAVAAVDGRVFAEVSLLGLTTTVDGLDALPMRSANLYIGPQGLGSSSSPDAQMLAPVSLATGTNQVAPSAEAQQAFSRLARDYRTPFSLLLSAHFVLPNGSSPTGAVTVAVTGRARAVY